MLVVDTNVLAYLLIAGDRTAAARSLHRADDDWHTDAFALIEFTNLLATLQRSRNVTPADAKKYLEAAERLTDGQTHSVAHGRASDVAATFGISGYDARFVALAMELETTLVTEDRRLRRAAPACTEDIDAAVARSTGG